MNNLLKILDSFQAGWTQRDYVHDFAAILKEHVIPTYGFLRPKIESNRAVFPEEWDSILSALKGSRIFELFIPSEYGGQRIPEQDIYLLHELLGYASPGMGIMFVSHGRAVDIIRQGSEELKKEFLPRMARGEMGAIAMTEGKAGSDASAVGLMAKVVDGQYILNGHKIFISNSGLADLYTVLTNTKGAKGPRSLSVFIVERDISGFSVKALPDKDGLQILPTGQLIFNETPVPSKNLVGEEGSGLLIALNSIDSGRIHIAGICCGLAHRIFRELYHYAHQRKQFDQPLTRSQDISFQLSDMFSQMNAARGLCLHALRQIGTPYYRISSSQAKLFATKMVMDIAAKAQILMGGRGYFKNDLINQLSADARGMEYMEGTSNIQKMIIASELFKAYRQEEKESVKSNVGI
ncbi:acyl-CoA dehydrogenase family protein [Thermodesulfobacteriota bacterium]